MNNLRFNDELVCPKCGNRSNAAFRTTIRGKKKFHEFEVLISDAAVTLTNFDDLLLEDTSECACTQCGFKSTVGDFVDQPSFVTLDDVMCHIWSIGGARSFEKLFPQMTERLTDVAENSKRSVVVQDNEGYEIWSYTPESRTKRDPVTPPEKFVFKPDKNLDPIEPTNGTRADCAEMAVVTHLQATGEPDVIDEDAVRDLISNLLHLADRMELDAAAIVEQSKKDWTRER